MDWIQALAILGGNVTMFLWATKQARTDFLHLDKKLDENRKETLGIVKEGRQETQAILKAMQDETKEFHGRLLDIERKKTK